MTIVSENKLLSVADAVAWLDKQGVSVSHRTAQRRTLAAIQRVQIGRAEPEDEQVQRPSPRFYLAPASWWLREFKLRPNQPPGRPRKVTNEQVASTGRRRKVAGGAQIRS